MAKKKKDQAKPANKSLRKPSAARTKAITASKISIQETGVLSKSHFVVHRVFDGGGVTYGIQPGTSNKEYAFNLAAHHRYIIVRNIDGIRSTITIMQLPRVNSQLKSAAAPDPPPTLECLCDPDAVPNSNCPLDSEPICGAGNPPVTICVRAEK